MSIQDVWKKRMAAAVLGVSLTLTGCGTLGGGVEDNTPVANAPSNSATKAAGAPATSIAPSSGPTVGVPATGSTATTTADTPTETNTPGRPVAPTASSEPMQAPPTLAATETPQPETPTQEPDGVEAPTEAPDGGPTSVVSYGTQPPEPTETPYPTLTSTPRPGKPSLERAVLVRGEPDPQATKSVTSFTVRDRKISLVGRIKNAPQYGNLYARWELVELAGLRKGQKMLFGGTATQSQDVAGNAPFDFTLDFGAPPQEGKYKVRLTIGYPEQVLKEIGFTIAGPAPRVIAQPGKKVEGGTGRLALRFPQATTFWQYVIVDEKNEEIAQQYGNSLEYEETPGVHQLPAGKYTLEWEAALGESGLFTVVVEAGRETEVELGALRIVSAQVPDQVLLVDKQTGRRAGGQSYPGSSKEGLLFKPSAIPAGQYEVYFQSNRGAYVRVADVTVKAGLVSTLKV